MINQKIKQTFECFCKILSKIVKITREYIFICCYTWQFLYNRMPDLAQCFGKNVLANKYFWQTSILKNHIIIIF